MKKIKNLIKHWWSQHSFCCSRNNYDRVSNKITKFDKEKLGVKIIIVATALRVRNQVMNLSSLDRVRLNNADRLIIVHLNINSLKNKFEMLRQIVQDKLDILLISDTKVHPSFPSSQIAKQGFTSPFRLGRNSSRGGIMLVVREEIP